MHHVISDVDLALGRPEDNAHQFPHAAQGSHPAVDLHLLHGLPAAEGRGQAAQPEDVIQVAVRQQDALEPLEPEPTAQDLPLGPLAAVDQEAVLAMKQQRGR